MKKLILAVLLLSLLVIVVVSAETIADKILDLKVTQLKNDRDFLENENKTLHGKITSILAMNKLNKIIEANNYYKPQESDIIYLQND